MRLNKGVFLAGTVCVVALLVPIPQAIAKPPKKANQETIYSPKALPPDAKPHRMDMGSGVKASAFMTAEVTGLGKVVGATGAGGPPADSENVTPQKEPDVRGFMKMCAFHLEYKGQSETYAYLYLTAVPDEAPMKYVPIRFDFYDTKKLKNALDDTLRIMRNIRGTQVTAESKSADVPVTATVKFNLYRPKNESLILWQCMTDSVEVYSTDLPNFSKFVGEVEKMVDWMDSFPH